MERLCFWELIEPLCSRECKSWESPVGQSSQTDLSSHHWTNGVYGLAAKIGARIRTR